MPEINPYSHQTLADVARAASNDLNQRHASRTAPADAALELAMRLRAASSPLALPSVTNPVIATLRLSTLGGVDASVESMRDFSGAMADRIRTAVLAQPPAQEYKALVDFCGRVAAASEPAIRRTSTLSTAPQMRAG